MAGRVTIFRMDGGDATLEQVRAMDEQLNDIAVEHGGIGHVVARDGDSIVMVNIWESAEGSDAMAVDPRVRAVMEKMGMEGPPPNGEYYEVVYSMFAQNVQTTSG